VELRPPAEIARTLDDDAALDKLPFMPEMLEFYGRKLRVAQRALTVCYYGTGSRRTFPADAVVTLEGVRCSGLAHEGCPKACMIFWHEAWLRTTDANPSQPEVDLAEIESLRSRLRASTDATTWYCQASELPKATRPMSRLDRVTRYVGGLTAGNFGVREMARDLGVSLYWWARTKLLGVYPRGRGKPPRFEGLDLQPGEWVEVRPLPEIIETLDENGQNSGLLFSPDMRRWCGRKARVKQRLHKIIVDGTGRIRKLRNTVILEDATCGCAWMGPGMAGCCRREFTYWREAWLRRCDASANQPSSVAIH